MVCRKRPSISPSKQSHDVAALKKRRNNQETSQRPAIVQSVACFYYQSISKCCDCSSRSVDDAANSECRFVNFRKLFAKSISPGDLHRFNWLCAGFLNMTDVSDADKAEWLPMKKEQQCSSDVLCLIERALVEIRPHILTICQSEIDEMARISHLSWRRRENGIKEQCDICQATLFNLHYFCARCGFVTCRQCRMSKVPKTQRRCSSSHGKATLLACCLIPLECLKSMVGLLKHLSPRPQPYLASPIGYQTILHRGSESYRFERPDRVGEAEMLSFESPLVISHVQPSIYKQFLFTLKNLEQTLGEQFITLVECSTRNLYYEASMTNFLQGFKSRQAREKIYSTSSVFKLSDYPSNGCLSEILPLHYQSFVESLPLGEVCSPNGRLNLTSHLPEGFLKPDLVKGYFAHGLADCQVGTTCLHLDVCDAVNVAVVVEGLEDEVETIRNYIYQCPLIAEEFKQRAQSEKPAAIWHIFKPEHRKKLERYLSERSDNNSETPIHDQTWYLNDDMLLEVSKIGIETITIVQFEHDAIYVGAGFAHQVRNLNSCFKIALDFVNPRRLDQAVKLDAEFRRLPPSHKNHEDKLQLRNVIYQATRYFLSQVNSEA